MYNNDQNSDSLDAGAADIRLTGNQRMASDPSGGAELYQIYQNALQSGQIPKGTTFEMFKELLQQSQAPRQNSGIMAAAPGTYTQNRKRIMAAGGGIMGSNNGSMLVAPTADGSRPGYAWYDFIVDPVKDFVQERALPFVVDKGGDFLSDLLGGDKDQPQPTSTGGYPNPDVDKLIYGMPQGSPGQLNPYIPPSGMPQGAPGGGDPNMYYKMIEDLVKTSYPSDEGTADEQSGSGKFEEPTTSGNPLLEFLKRTGQTIMPGGEPGFIDLYDGGGGGGGGTSIFRQAANIGIPLAAGKFAHDYQRDYLARQPEFPIDDTGITFQTARQAMDDPNLRFKPKLEDTQLAADGGRIGFDAGGNYEAKIKELMDKGLSRELAEVMVMSGLSSDRYDIEEKAQGGRIGAQEGGLMDLGGMEKDYRQEGGFVPIGGKEKADDVPARLSKNEFVFTADAVRAAGGGNIDKGASIMERLMDNLEAGGKVSEESQGLEGARGMFANAQKLQNRII